MKRNFGGVTLILIATVVAGVAGYAIQWLVPFFEDTDVVTPFIAFWSALYFVVSALSGIQQELSRATRPRAADAGAANAGAAGAPAKSTARNFGLMVSAGVFVLIAATGVLWMPLVVPGQSWLLALPLALGVASYVLVATLSGTLYGVRAWKAIAWLIALDGVLRLIAIALAVALSADVAGIAWAVALPFPAAAAIVWFVIRRDVVGKTEVDVGIGALSWNVLRTVVAGAATGVIVSGFPFLLTATSPTAAGASLASLLVVLTLTRAPLIIPIMALQSFLVVRFRDAADRFWRDFLAIVGLIAVAAIVLGALAWWLGPWIISVIFAGKFDIDGAVIGLLVASAGLTGALCVSGPAVLSTGNHSVFTAGWIAGAAVTVAALFLPLDVEQKAIVALSLGPAVGFAVHVVGLVAARRRVGLEPA